MFVTDWFTRDRHGQECNAKRRTWIVNGKLLLTYGQQVDPEFLAKLAADCVSVGFSGFAFPAGKLPQTAVPLVRWPLANKELIASSSDGRDNANRIR